MELRESRSGITPKHPDTNWRTDVPGALLMSEGTGFPEMSMLLKYLNDLEHAVQKARREPGVPQYRQCADCLLVLRRYLDTQVEPVRRRGEEIIEELLPEQFSLWMLQVQNPRALPVRIAG